LTQYQHVEELRKDRQAGKQRQTERQIDRETDWLTSQLILPFCRAVLIIL